MMRMLLEAPHRVRYGIQAKVGGILWSDELDMVGILLNIGCKEFALVGAIHEYIHDSPDGDSDPPSLSCVLDTRVILFPIRDTVCPGFHGSICLSSLVCCAQGCRVHRVSSHSTRDESSNLRLARQRWLVRMRTVQWLMRWYACLALHDLDQRCYQVERQREDDGRVLLHRDLGQRLQVA